MDLTVNKPVIINACVGGGWYPAGTERLVRSLNHVGWAGSVLTWKNQWPNLIFPQESNYNVKCSAFLEAMQKGFTHILWCDSSVWALNDPMPIFDIIEEKGYFFWSSGYNCAQTCNDKSLEYFKVNRDQAEKWPDVATGIFGLNLQNEKGFMFLSRWMTSCHDGIFNGSRFHDNQSSDPRFLFHRQDQSCASLIASILEMPPMDHNLILGNWKREMPYSWIFTLRGI